MFNGARIIGPAIAGLLVASIGEGWCFFVNAASYLAVIVGLFLMRVEAPRRLAADGPPLQHIIEGFRFVKRTGPILTLLLLLGLVSVAAMPYSVLMPVFADRILHGGAQGLGILMGATGIGALLGALTLASRSGLRGLGLWIAWSCGGFGAFLILFSLSRHFWLSTALLIPVGFCMMIELSASNTLIQAIVPDELRGRVMAAYSMMLMGMGPFGALLAGALADRIGAPVTVALGAIACVGGAILFGMRLPNLRAEARQLIVAQRTAREGPSTQVAD